MKKTLSIIIILLICFLILPSALADGGFFIKIHDEDIWRLFDEEQQFCAINYKDGVQHMILTIDTAEKVQGDQAVWIFPVPADPKQVDINILKGFPELFGKDLERLAENSISQAYTLMSISQIYPFPFAYFGTLSPGAFRAGSMEKSLDAEGVTVYERIEKMGLTTELVGALDSQSLENYLTSKDLKLPPEFTLILDEYIGKHYVFVITWISDVHEFRNSQADVEYDYYYRRRTGNTVGVFISFPTPKIYYPLKPTSVYGDTVVPAVIYVMGYVQPELYKEIKADSEITFFSESTHKAPKDLKDFYSGYSLPAISSRESNYYISNLEYTKVKISAPSNALIQDLWFKNEVPNKVVVYESLINRIIWWGLIIFIFISCLSSLLAGIIVFRNDNPHLFKFALFGLFNFLTLVGVWIAAYIKGVDHAFTERKQAVYQRIKLEGRQKTAIAIPLSIIIVITLLIPVSILLQLQDIIFPLLFSLFVGFIFFPFIIFVPLILWGYYKHKKVLVFNLVFSGMFLVLLILSRIILAIFI